jgi:hypothetical protein
MIVCRAVIRNVKSAVQLQTQFAICATEIIAIRQLASVCLVITIYSKAIILLHTIV